MTSRGSQQQSWQGGSGFSDAAQVLQPGIGEHRDTGIVQSPQKGWVGVQDLGDGSNLNAVVGALVHDCSCVVVNPVGENLQPGCGAVHDVLSIPCEMSFFVTSGEGTSPLTPGPSSPGSSVLSVMASIQAAKL